MLLLDGKPLVNPYRFAELFQRKRVPIELVSKCNQQEFRYIGGAGVGYFLTLDGTIPVNGLATLDVDGLSVNVSVVDRYKLMPTGSASQFYVYITEEAKSILNGYLVDSNFNEVLDTTLPITTADPDPLVRQIDGSSGAPKTLEQIIQDILPSGYTLTYSAQTFYPLDIGIEGMTVLDAIDELCRAFCLLWTVEGTTVYVVSLSGTTPDESAFMPVNYVELSDAVDARKYAVHFPIYGFHRTHQYNYYTYGGGSGAKTFNLECPYVFGYYSSGSVLNSTGLDSVGQDIIDNAKGILRTFRYLEKHYHYAGSLLTPPVSIAQVHGDFADGQRSVYKWIDYPFVIAKKVGADDRQARNWIGELASSFKDRPAAFYARPLVGLDGWAPSTIQRIENIYNWEHGKEGWKVRVEWDPNDKIWIPLQMEYACDEPGSIGPPPGSIGNPWE